MTIASVSSRLMAYKKESSWGTPAGATGAQYMRLTADSGINLQKDSYESNEIRSDQQRFDFRHGIQRVNGNLNGEFSPKTYADIIGSILRRDHTAISALTGLSITVGGTSGAWTLTRGSGDWLAGGIKIGQVVRLTAGSFNASNLNKNIFVTGVTSTVITGMVLNGTALVTEGPIATATLSVPGKVTYTPTTGHTDDSYSVEEWHPDITQSELFWGIKVTSAAIALPPTGLATISMPVLGKGLTAATSQYFTTPTAPTTTGIDAAVNGILLVGGSQIVTCTGLNLRLDGGHQAANPVVAANTLPAIFRGDKVAISGDFTAYFESAALRDYLVNETEIALAIALTTSNAAAADVNTFVIPRLKLTGADKSANNSGFVRSYPFQALFNSAGGSSLSTEATTLYVQDTAA